MKKRLLLICLTLLTCVSLLSTGALAAGTLYAKPYYTNPQPGTAVPASETGATPAEPYSYSETSLFGENNSWFSCDGASYDNIEFEAVFTQID